MCVRLNHILLLLLLLIIVNYGYACGGWSDPTADFSVDNTTPVVDETIFFTDNSTDADSWSWTFDDGVPSVSSAQNPSVSFSSAGIKTVQLEVSNNYGSDTHSVTINVGLPPSEGSIGANQSICSGGTPDALISVTDGGGTGLDGYEWQTNASGSWADISGVSSSTYQPPALTATTSYRRRTVATHGTTRYSDYTSEVIISVADQPTAPVLTRNPDVDGVCADEVLTVDTVAGSGGAGTVADEFRYSTDNGLIWSSWATVISDFAAVVGTNLYQSRRTADGNGCVVSSSNQVSWSVNSTPDIVISAPADGSSDCPQLEETQEFNGETGNLGYSVVVFTINRPTGASSWDVEYQINGTNASVYSGSPHQLNTVSNITGITDSSYDVEIWIQNVELVLISLRLLVSKITDTNGCENDNSVTCQTYILQIPSVGEFN